MLILVLRSSAGAVGGGCAPPNPPCDLGRGYRPSPKPLPETLVKNLVNNLAKIWYRAVLKTRLKKNFSSAFARQPGMSDEKLFAASARTAEQRLC